MGRRHKLPGISEENTTRRNVLVGTGYGFAGLVGLGMIAPDSEEERNGGQAAESDDTTPEPEPDTDDSDDTVEGEIDDEEEEEEEEEEDLSEPPDPIEDEYSGNGSDVIGPFKVELSGPVVFVMEHDGESNFQVELLDETGETEDFLANEIGAWGGANASEAPPGEYRLDVEADGGWDIMVTQQPEYFGDEVDSDFPQSLDGNTDDVFGPVNFESARTISWDCEGDGNNIITVLEATGKWGDLVLNEIGPDSGSGVSSIRSEVGWLDVEMSGAYEITIEE